jgi:hypothetical protein
MQAAKLLDLNPEAVRAYAEAYEGFSFVARDLRREEHPAWLRANYLAIAASYWSAVDLERGRKCFEMACKAALEQAHQSPPETASTDHPRGQMLWELRAASMAACARIPDPLQNLASRWGEQTRVLSPSALMLALVTAGQLVFNGDHETVTGILRHLMHSAHALEHHPAGNLQLPLGLFFELIEQAISTQIGGESRGSDRDARFRAVRDWTFQFSHRLSERVAVAQSNRNHWHRLYSKLLPLEPEAICALLIWARTLRRTARNTQEIRSLSSDLSPTMQAYLETVKDVLLDEDQSSRRGQNLEG